MARPVLNSAPPCVTRKGQQTYRLLMHLGLGLQWLRPTVCDFYIHHACVLQAADDNSPIIQSMTWLQSDQTSRRQLGDICGSFRHEAAWCHAEHKPPRVWFAKST